jgi:cob(I)alamin adenosyltransferase
MREIKSKVLPREKRKGVTLVFTGNGQGKTTASLGILIRATGRGLKGIMIQFLKSKKSEYGEHIFAKKVGLKILPLGLGCTWTSPDLNKDKIAARKCWEKCKTAIKSEKYDLVILDEITYAINFKWIPLSDVVKIIKNKPSWMHIIITGRNAPKELIKIADTVTEMKEIKHAFKKGIFAQAGIEL